MFEPAHQAVLNCLGLSVVIAIRYLFLIPEMILCKSRILLFLQSVLLLNLCLSRCADESRPFSSAKQKRSNLWDPLGRPPPVLSKTNSPYPIPSPSGRRQPQPTTGFVRRGADGTPTTPLRLPHTLPDGYDALGTYGRRQTQAFASPAAHRSSHAEEHRTHGVVGPTVSDDIISQPLPLSASTLCARHRCKKGTPTTQMLERGLTGQYEPVGAKERTQVEATDPLAYGTRTGKDVSASPFQGSCNMCRAEAVVKPLKRKWKSTENGKSDDQHARAMRPSAVETRPASAPSMSPEWPATPAAAPVAMASMASISIQMLASPAQSLPPPTPAVSAPATDTSVPIEETSAPTPLPQEQVLPTPPLDTSIPAATATPDPSLSPRIGRVSDSKHFVKSYTRKPSQNLPTNSSNNTVQPAIPQPSMVPIHPETAHLTDLTTAIHHLNIIISTHRNTLKHLTSTLSAELGRLSPSLDAVGAKLQDLPMGPGRSVVEMTPRMRTQVDTFAALIELLDANVEVWRAEPQTEPKAGC